MSGQEVPTLVPAPSCPHLPRSLPLALPLSPSARHTPPRLLPWLSSSKPVPPTPPPPPGGPSLVSTPATSTLRTAPPSRSRAPAQPQTLGALLASHACGLSLTPYSYAKSVIVKYADAKLRRGRSPAHTSEKVLALERKVSTPSPLHSASYPSDGQVPHLYKAFAGARAALKLPLADVLPKGQIDPRDPYCIHYASPSRSSRPSSLKCKEKEATLGHDYPSKSSTPAPPYAAKPPAYH